MLDPVSQAGGVPAIPPAPPAPPSPPPPSSTTTTTTSPPPTTAAPPGTTYLSDLSTTVAVNGLGAFERNRANGGSGANDGPALKLKNVTYPKGIGVNGYSELEFPIPSGATSFRASIGLDDSACAATMRVEVKLNGSYIDVSGLPSSFTKSTPTYSLNVNVTGKTRLRLSAVNTGTALSCDHFDWADARFLGPVPPTTTAAPPTTTAPPTTSPPTTSSTTTTTTTTTTSSTTTTTSTTTTSTTTTTTTTLPTSSTTPTTTAPPPTTAPANVTYLSDLTPTLVVNGLGQFERNRANGGSAANDGAPQKLRGVTYPKGIGVNAYSEIEFPIPSGATSFRAVVGVDDSACASTMRVELKLNGSAINVSGLPKSFTKSSPAYSLTVNVTGKTKLRLQAVNTGTASNCDHFDWADARFLR